jgi:PAS domain S-box-containing protein
VEDWNLRAADLIGKTRWDLAADRDEEPEKWRAHIAALDAHQPFRGLRYRITRSDGSSIYLSASGKPVFDGQGEFLGYRGVATDVSAEVRAEKALRESEERFRTLMQFSFDVYWETDAQHRFIRQDFSERVTDGPLPGSELGKRRWELPYLDIDEETWRKHRETLDAHLPFRDLEYGRPTPSGGKRYAAVSGLPMFDEARRFIGYRGVGRHVTERKQMEEALRQREKELREVVATIRAMAVMALPDGSNVFSNRRWTEYTGLSAEDAESSGWQAAVHPDDLDRYVSKWRGSLASGGAFENEVRLRRAADGEYRWFLARFVPLRDERGDILRWYGILADIEDRKRADAALRESEGRFRKLTDLSADWYWKQDENLRFTYFSDDVDEKAGSPAADSLGRTRWELRVTPLSDTWEQHRAMLAARQPFRDFKYSRIDQNGEARYISVSGVPMFDDQGVFKGYDGVASNVTPRYRAEQALRESEEQWKAVFENNPIMYFMVDATGTILSVNPFGAEQLGYTVDELIGRPVHEVFHEADRAEVQRNAAICFGQLGQALSWELRKVRKNGEVIWVRETARATLIKDRPVVLIVCEDITEHKRTAEVLRVTQMELAHANRIATMGQLTASIAHEVKQPITATVTGAQGALRWLGAQPPDLAEVREALDDIIKDGERAGDVIDRIRALVKKAPLQKDWLDINETIYGVIALTHSEAARQRVRVETQFAEDLPLVLGDRVQLQQVVLNLIINAIEAMSDIGGGRREVLISTQQAEPDGVLVTVSDTGPGLDPDSLPHLFEAFYTTKPDGTGMGLSICGAIVEAHGGRLWATADRPRGAVFHFAVPARPGLASPPAG